MIVRKRYTWDPKDKYGPIASTGPITAFTVKNPSYNPLDVGVPKGPHNYGNYSPNTFSGNRINNTKYDDEYFAMLRNQVYGDAYGNETHTHYPSNQQPNSTKNLPATRSQATLTKKRKMPQNNTFHPFLTRPLSSLPRATSKQHKIHPFLTRPLSSLPQATSNAEVTIYKDTFDMDKLNEVKKYYLQSANHGFKLTFQGPNQEDTDSYEIVLGKDGKKIWKELHTGGKRRTRSSRKRSKRTVRKQRK